MWRISFALVMAAAVQILGCIDPPEEKKAASPVVAARPDAPLMARVSPQGRKNLGLIIAPIALASFKRTMEVPAEVKDRPGVSDRGVVAPVTGVVTQIFAYPGDTVAADQPLFAMRLVSERLHASQLELFKAAREIEIAKQQRQRLAGLGESGVVPQARVIEIDNRLQMLDVTVQAYRQDLLARGVPSTRVDAAARGEFVTEVTVRAPNAGAKEMGAPAGFEIQSLRVALGQQVEAGTVLCELADHRRLLIEGHAFKSDLPQLHQAVQANAPVAAEFEEEQGGIWTEPLPLLHIEHIANSVDPETRVIRFNLPLENQWREYSHGDTKGLLWRFRPGDRMRLKIPVSKLDGVFVMPREGVIREGAEAYVFRQNGDLFERQAVTIVEESRTHVAIADDGSIKRGAYLAQNGAAALQRIAKAQAASGMPANVHVHADGTVHAAH